MGTQQFLYEKKKLFLDGDAGIDFDKLIMDPNLADPSDFHNAYVNFRRNRIHKVRARSSSHMRCFLIRLFIAASS